MTHECVCGRPLAGDAICQGCAYSLQVALGDISSYWCDLDNVKGRRTRYGATGGRGGDKPLPVDARFLGWDADGTRLQDAVKNTMGTWARIVLDERPVLTGPTHPACLHITCSQLNRSRPPRDDVASVCRYLLGQSDWIKTQHWAGEILDEMLDTASQMQRMVDRPADKLFVGYCTEDDEPLHARIGAPSTKCRVCEKEFGVEASRDAMWVEAQDRLATASEIARAISWLGKESVSAERIRKWVERDRLERRGTIILNGRELPTYRIGDVAALVEAASRDREAS